MKRILLIFMMVFVCVYSYCCNCIGAVTFKNEYKRSNIVIIGKVVDKKNISIIDSLIPLTVQIVEYKVQILKVFKGKIKGSTIKIITGIGNGDCGFEFTEEEEYIIYCSYKNKHYKYGETVNKFLYTDICRRTRLANDKDELKLLNMCLPSGSEALREAHVGAKRAKHRAKQSPECADPKRSVGARPK